MEGLNLKVLEIVKREGPILPVRVAKKVERDIIFASAILSELISGKEVLITKGKIGGSPLYYVKGQEPKLQTLYSYFGDKPKKAFSLLKEKKILQDTKLEPWQRVALREIQDFAKPIEVRTDNGTDIFWRWYLISDAEAQSVINNLIMINTTEKPVQVKPEVVKPTENLKKFDDTSLIGEAKNYFRVNNIDILEEKVLRKNSEIDFLVNIPSEIGKLNYFVKVKSKKRVNEGDLSLARDKGRERKLPVLFLSKGDMTKKAKEYLEKNLKGYLIFKMIS